MVEISSRNVTHNQLASEHTNLASFVKSEIFTAVLMNIQAQCHAMLCQLLNNNGCFRAIVPPSLVSCCPLALKLETLHSSTSSVTT